MGFLFDEQSGQDANSACL